MTTSAETVTPLRAQRRGARARARRTVARAVRRVAPPRVRHHRILEHAICQVLLGDRLRLPEVTPATVVDGFDDAVVAVDRIPVSRWETPVADAIALAKIVAAGGVERVLELGSHSGSTTRMLARHLTEGGRIVAVDLNPDHGWDYRETPEAARIERRVGAIGADLFAPGERFDLVFVDADHRYAGVAHDTELALGLLAADGWLVWHDYANWGWLDGACGVPEFLHDLAARLPLVSLAGTSLVVHRPCWVGEGGTRPWDGRGDAAPTTAPA